MEGMSLEFILIIAFGGALLSFILSKISNKFTQGFAVIVSLSLLFLIACFYGKSVEHSVYFHFLGFPLLLRLNMLSWLFAMAIAGLGVLCVIFSLSYMKNKEKLPFFYLMLLWINASMLGIVFSGDLLSFFIFWEMMSWSTFLLISYNRGAALSAGMKYIIMSMAGSLAMLVGIITIYVNYQTLTLSELAVQMSSVASSGPHLLVLILFFMAFGIKNAVVPFHPWLPPAHSEAPSPFSAILSGILIKMGTYGFVLLLYVLIGLKNFLELQIARYILGFLAAITILVPTFMALLQNDAKRLLAWSTVAQAGYIFMGLVFATPLGVMGGLFHFMNHAIFKALLFLVIGAVEFRTHGVRDLDSLGGFIKIMPVTFFAALVGVCGLIGVPLTNGFVSKWLIYKTLILEKAPFLAFAALFGTWGTILYSYKLIHHVFLGQLPVKYKTIQKAPFTMQLPMLILAVLILVFGILPGIPLSVINNIDISLGLDFIPVNVWGIVSETGTLNMVNLFSAIAAGLILVWLLLKTGPKSPYVSQTDTYAAGSAIPDEKYQYTVNFYNPLYRMITPYLKDIVDAFYEKCGGWTQNLSNVMRQIYTGYVGHYVFYVILFLAGLIFIQLKWSLW